MTVTTYGKVLQLHGLMRAGRLADGNESRGEGFPKGLGAVFQIAERLTGELIDEIKILEGKVSNLPE